MITIEDTRPVISLPNWEKVQTLIGKSKNDILVVAHRTVNTRLTFANLHITILRQAQDNSIKRAMFEDVVINLVSSLQALAHVINQLYEIGIKDLGVSIDHLNFNNEKRQKESMNRCLRCKLKNHSANIAYTLDELLKTGSAKDDWYRALIEFRHQIVHRHHYIAHVSLEGYYLPDDPNELEPKEKSYYDKDRRLTVWTNYTKRREIKRFTELLYKLVSHVIESVYKLISMDIRIRRMQRLRKNLGLIT